MEGFCRSCLVKYDEPTDLMPYSEKNRRMFVYATGLQVKRNDTFIFQLCKDCHLNMKVACNFKKTSRDSDKKFKNYLACREAGDSVDFCTFLKNNDESLKFRLPMFNDNSTPANRNREDDVESTCTSIQNFMTDILKAEDIPDSEARIIKEVIEEEADILDDSLDSHWLQDDVSIDTDLKMNFSFSPFSTPRSTVDDDHSYTPKRLNDPTAIDHKENNTASKLDTNNQGHRVDNLNSNIIHKDYETLKEYVKSSDKCVIDMNLENALKNDSTKKVMLDELLATPPVLPNVSVLSTPLINNILFGDKIDIDSENRQKNVYMPPNMIKPEDIDVLYEFFQKSDEKDEIIEEYPLNYDDIYMQEDINENEKNYLNIQDENKNQAAEDIKEPTSPVENKYCLEKFHCKVCDRRFKNMLAIKTHFRRRHKIKIVAMAPKRPKVRQKMICDYCGKIFMSPQCITKHIQNHMNPDQYDCEHCPLSFRTENGLKSHRTTHGIVYQRDDNKKKRKKYVCNICGSVQSSASNHCIHMRRHERKYAMSCALCGKGFYRTSDLDVHMRIHTGERPFACMYCPSKFARQDVLNRHIKCHTGEKPYLCPFCNDKFLSGAILKRHQLECKSCLEKQKEILLENSDQNNMDNVTVYYANVSNNAEVSKIAQVFNNTEVPKVVENSNNAEVSKIAQVFNNTEVPKVVEDSNNAEVSKIAQVFNNTEVPKVVENSNNAEVSKIAQVFNNTEVPKVVEDSNNAEVCKNAEITIIAEVTNDAEVTNIQKYLEN